MIVQIPGGRIDQQRCAHVGDADEHRVPRVRNAFDVRPGSAAPASRLHGERAVAALAVLLGATASTIGSAPALAVTVLRPGRGQDLRPASAAREYAHEDDQQRSADS